MSPTTFRSYKQQYEHAVKPMFGKTLLKDLKGDAVQAWLNTMTAGAASHAKGILRIIMCRACDLDYIDSTPWIGDISCPKKWGQQGVLTRYIQKKN